jgi:argininosuccinate lyase
MPVRDRGRFADCRARADELEILTAMLPALPFDTGRMATAADGLLHATDVADLLVEHGVPFRKAHELVGALVRHCLATETGLREVDDATLRFRPEDEFGWTDREVAAGSDDAPDDETNLDDVSDHLHDGADTP